MTGKWCNIDDEDFRIYIFPNGELRIDHPKKLMVKRDEKGHNHRIIAEDEDGNPISYFVPCGWLAIYWPGIDGTEQFGWKNNGS